MLNLWTKSARLPPRILLHNSALPMCPSGSIVKRYVGPIAYSEAHQRPFLRELRNSVTVPIDPEASAAPHESNRSLLHFAICTFHFAFCIPCITKVLLGSTRRISSPRLGDARITVSRVNSLTSFPSRVTLPIALPPGTRGYKTILLEGPACLVPLGRDPNRVVDRSAVGPRLDLQVEIAEMGGQPRDIDVSARFVPAAEQAGVICNDESSSNANKSRNRMSQ